MNDYPLLSSELNSEPERHPGRTALWVSAGGVALVEFLAGCGGISAGTAAEPMVSTPAHPCITAKVQSGEGLIQTINRSLMDPKGANIPDLTGFDGVRDAAITITSRTEAANKSHVVDPGTYITYCYFPKSKHVVDPQKPE